MQQFHFWAYSPKNQKQGLKGICIPIFIAALFHLKQSPLKKAIDVPTWIKSPDDPRAQTQSTERPALGGSQHPLCWACPRSPTPLRPALHTLDGSGVITSRHPFLETPLRSKIPSFVDPQRNHNTKDQPQTDHLL